MPESMAKRCFQAGVVDLCIAENSFAGCGQATAECTLIHVFISSGFKKIFGAQYSLNNI